MTDAAGRGAGIKAGEPGEALHRDARGARCRRRAATSTYPCLTSGDLLVHPASVAPGVTRVEGRASCASNKRTRSVSRQA
jgi:hypothetical protein